MTLLLTRPQQDSETIAKLLPDISCFIEPMFEVINHDVIIYQPDKIKLVICTSKHAVHGLNNAFLAPDTLFFAIGDTTTTALKDLGFSRIVNANDDLQQLIRHILQLGLSSDDEILYLRGAKITLDLVNYLSKYKLTWREIIAYHTVPRPALSQTLITAINSKEIRTAAFFSENTAKIFCELAQESHLLESLRTITIFTISDKVAQVFNNLAFQEAIIFEKTNKLLELVSNYYTYEKKAK